METSDIFASSTFTPYFGLLLVETLARSWTWLSIGSIPAFLAKVNGIDSSVFINFSADNCSLPSNLLDYSLSLWDTNASGAPAPVII